MMEEEVSTQWIVAVDDEPNILMALRRALRPTGAEFSCFESAEEALAAFATREPDVVISDMRMPGMDGAEFLAKAKALHPQSLRILLTGYADYDKARSAINEGGIWRSLAKPWKDEELMACVGDALSMRRLWAEKRRLELLTRAQRDELALLNRTLEAKVAERTAKIETNFATLVKVLSGIVDARFHHRRAHRVAEIARSAAVQLNLSKAECDRIHRAALLHLIGKIAFSDGLLATPSEDMSSEQLHAARAYPINAEEMLMALEDLRPEAAIIRSHCERMDGMGFPDHLFESDIPMGSKLLGAAVVFDELLGERSLSDPAAAAQAARDLAKMAGRRVCEKSSEAILAAFCIKPSAEEAPARVGSRLVECRHLAPGMVLARDAQAPSGALLLAAGQTLTPVVISQLQRFQERHGAQLRFLITNTQEF